MREVSELIKLAVKSQYGLDVDAQTSRPEVQFGDVSSNVALQITKQVGKNPRQIAEEIVEVLATNKDLIAEASVAGPGFINIRLVDQVLLTQLDNFDIEQTNSGKKILVEYSDPNPFKPLHAGHLYTTLVGDTIARLVERSGAEVVRLNYGGDVGLHVGKCMWAILKYLGGENPDKLEAVASSERAKWLGERYVEGSTAYEDDEQARKQIIEINKRVYALHSEADKQSNFAKIYWQCREWSYDYLKELYTQLEVVDFDRFIPESEVFSLGLEAVREQQQNGVYQESDGAVVYKGEDKGLHTRVFINSEGLPTYEAKDVGLMLLKWRDYHFDQSIMITANEQSQYMQVVMASVVEFEPEIVARTKHMTHGVVKLAGGVKMSSRKGSVVTAIDIINSATEAAEKGPNSVGRETVLAAIKYSFTKNKIGGDVVYDPEESVALEGNSGPYLQYAHARAMSILAKEKGDLGAVVSLSDSTVQLEASERQLVAKLCQYKEVLGEAVDSLAPHLITTYMYELAQEFNRFYENTRVIGSPRQDFLLQLVKKYAEVLKDALSILGITAPDRM